VWTPACAALAATGAALAGGCTVGAGAGSATGPMFMVGCDVNSDFGTVAAPVCFDLEPRFFAGVPIEDIAVGPLENRLVINMQHTGNRVEINDTLSFDITNTFEVARCLRGALTPDGQPDWDTRQVITVKGVCTGVPWCDWSARGGVYATSTCVGIPGPAEMPLPPPLPPVNCPSRVRDTAGLPDRPQIHLGPEEFISVSFVPLFTCSDARLSATAVDGFIDFLDFGPPLTAPPPGDFKVDFGSRLQANFHMVMQDDRVLSSIKLEEQILAPRIGGTFDGYFDFNLERGRAAQPFP
jgi:hypothetical protein